MAGVRLISTVALAVCGIALLPAAAQAAIISSNTPNPLLDGFADDAECSLREMVAIANADSTATEPDCTVVNALGDDTIQLGAGEYTLTTLIDGTPNINDGDLEVFDPEGGTLTIDGQGSSNTIVDGGDHDRVFDASGGAFTLQQLTVRGGQVTGANGGGISTGAPLLLESSRVTQNEALTTGNGGGIFAAQSTAITLSNTSVDRNVSANTGGGIELRQSADVITQGNTTIGGATPAAGNSAGSQGGGINVSAGAGGNADVDLNPGTTVENNTAVAVGGGIAHTITTAGSDLTVDGASINDNDLVELPASGLAVGGGVHFVGGAGQTFHVGSGSEISGNTATGDEATGAGINVTMSAGTAEFSQSSISDNVTTVEGDADNGQVEGGGGFTTSGAAPVSLTEMTVQNNTVAVQDLEDSAVGGGILSNGILTLERSLVTENTVLGGDDDNVNFSPRGAGLYVGQPQGATEVSNSTFSGNVATPGAGVGGDSVGGGIVANLASGTLDVLHSTFTQNSAARADALNVAGAPLPNAALTLSGNLFADGTDACIPDRLGEDSNFYNVDAEDSCVGVNADTDLVNATTMLDPGLSANGGPTFTHALLAGSPAIGFVPAAQCLDLDASPLTVDQRGFGRPAPAGGACDAGSYEVQDTDGDGVVDVDDNCPTQAGTASNGGCPVSTTPPPDTTPPPATTRKCPKGKKPKKVKGKRKCVKRKKKRR